MKSIRFLGDSLKRLRDFPASAKQNAGYQLDRVQRGLPAVDSKPMPSIGKGVEEIRIRDAAGAFRLFFTARLLEAVYVLHVFQKKTQKTAEHDIELARARFSDLMRGEHDD